MWPVFIWRSLFLGGLGLCSNSSLLCVCINTFYHSSDQSSKSVLFPVAELCTHCIALWTKRLGCSYSYKHTDYSGSLVCKSLNRTYWKRWFKIIFHTFTFATNKWFENTLYFPGCSKASVLAWEGSWFCKGFKEFAWDICTISWSVLQFI